MKAFVPLLLILLPALFFSADTEEKEIKNLDELESFLDFGIKLESNTSSKNTAKDAFLGLEKLVILLQTLKERAQALKTNTTSLADYQTQNSLKKLDEDINVIEALLVNLKNETKRAEEELKNTNKLANKVINSESNLNKSDEFKNKILHFHPIPTERNLDDSPIVQKGKEIQGHMGTCLGAFFKNVPPSFCWKKGGDFGVIPTDCPAGYFRFLAMCYKECESGYTFFWGVCWQICPDHYSDYGVICGRSIFRWFFKSSYIPHILTNFDDRVPCPHGMYKGLALCYRDCNNHLMVNCGIGACAQSTASCVEGIVTMALDFLAGLGEFILFIVTKGFSSAATPAAASAKTGLKNGIKKAGQSALKSAFQNFKNWITSFSKEEVKKWLNEKVKEFVVGQIVTFTIQKACEVVGDYIFDEVQKKSEPTLTFMDQVKEYADKIPIYGKCSKVELGGSSWNDEIACVKDILEIADLKDPTGLCAMAAAFMQPTCEI